MHGTGFVALREERLFFVTAAHGIKEGQQDALRIPIRAGKPDTMTFGKFMTFGIPGEESHELDIAALSIEPITWLDRYDLWSTAIPVLRFFSLDDIIKEVTSNSIGAENIVLRALPLIPHRRGDTLCKRPELSHGNK